MKISILTPDLSHNCLGRAYLLAKILQRDYEVEIVGPMFGEGIWQPVADDKKMKYQSVKIRGKFKPYWQIKELIKKIEGDVVYAHKPLLTSFGMGLFKKLLSNRPLVLDIDDWQMGLMKENYQDLPLIPCFKSLARSIIRFYDLGSYWNNLLGEKLSFLADEITVSNTFLKEKFGGTIVWHGRDTEAFNPKRFDKKLMRKKYRIDEEKKVVIFLGTPRPYKGIEDLIEALTLLKERKILLMLVGLDKDSYSKKIRALARDRLSDEKVKLLGLQSFGKVPEFLATSDLVVIPQRKTPATVGQVPAKVFDAMAMAKPIIATDVSDLPTILDGCGWIVKPRDLESLAKTIRYVFTHSKEAERRGWRARKRCVEKYSWEAMEKILLSIFHQYE